MNNQAHPRTVAIELEPLATGSARRYALMRWLTLGAITVACLFSSSPGTWWPGMALLAAAIAAYVGLVKWQYQSRCAGGALRMRPELYMVISALLVFAMATFPAVASQGETLWYNVMFFVVLAEGRHVGPARNIWLLFGLCLALVHLSVLVDLHRGDWPTATLQFLPLDAGLLASTLGARLQRKQEEEHAARLDLLTELEASKARLEEANHQLHVYAGTAAQLAVASERNRLARDLHDILGYTLATVVVKAEAAKRLLAADPARAREELDRVQEVARTGLAEVRRSVAGLRDTAAAAGVWHEALAGFIDTFGQETGLCITQEIAPLPEDHDPALEVCLFRVTQEALTNVARHAGASHVEVNLHMEDGKALLLVVDDGVGSGPAGAASGFGLRGMRERVEQLGGRLVFSSKRGEGTRVLVEVPLCPAAHRAMAAEAAFLHEGEPSPVGRERVTAGDAHGSQG